MRPVLAIAIAMLCAGCDDDMGPTIGPDAGADALPQSTCGEPGEGVLGCWRIAWNCPDGCAHTYNPLGLDTELTITETTASYRGAGVEADADHAGAIAGGCFAVATGEDFGVARQAYRICRDDDGGAPRITATITWSGYPGPPDPRAWRLTGVR